MLSTLFPPDPTPVLQGSGLILRGARRADYQAWRDLRLASMSFLRPYEPRWSEIDLSLQVFRARLARARREAMAGSELSFLIFQDGGKEKLMGGVTLSNIRRRAAQQCYFGYWMGAEFARQGVMSRAVSMLVPFCFGEFGLHRLQAATLPHNLASRRVLEKNGFREEGFAENYLQIDGAWRDHVLYALTRERYEGLRD